MSATLVEFVLSIGLGLVFLASSIPKLRDPRRFVLATIEYRILPPGPSRLYARIVPPLELVAALALVGGIAVRASAILVTFLLINFLIALSVNIARGRDIDCHCFGHTRRRVGWGVLWHDLLLLSASLALAALHGTWTGPAVWSPFHRFGSGASIGACLVIATICTLWLQHSSGYRLRRKNGARARSMPQRMVGTRLASSSKPQRGRK